MSGHIPANSTLRPVSPMEPAIDDVHRSLSKAPQMLLMPLERDFLKQLCEAAWVSPPLFDHNLLARLVEAAYVQTKALPSGEVRYEITNVGKVALEST
jgi:hypothetical protein